MLISVIVPVYNAEKFLNKSIEGVIHQSYTSIQLILVNDGSTDGSEALCNKYALTDNRILVFSQKNSGPAAARNTGLRHASGYFVFFLDADDFIERNAFETLIAEYERSRPDMVMANFSKLVNGRDMVRQRIAFRPDDEPFEARIKELSRVDIVAYVRHFLKHPSNHLISYCWARLYKLSIIRDHGIQAPEDMRLFEDFVFNLKYLKHTETIVFVNEPLYIYTMNTDHVSASMAIINGDSLLHDMESFKVHASAFLRQAKPGPANAFDPDKEIGHALVHYVIIFLVRSCRQITKEKRKGIFREITKIVNASILRESLRYYSPSKGNSRILPFLMKLKLVGILMALCKCKAYKRYGKLGAA